MKFIDFLALQIGSLGPLSAMIDLVASGVSHIKTIPTQRYNRRHRRSEEDLDTARISLEYHLYEIKEKIFLMNLKEFHWNYEIFLKQNMQKKYEIINIM